MQRIERVVITAPTLVAALVAGSASALGAHSVRIAIPGFTLSTSSVVAILGVLLILMCPVGSLSGGVAGLIQKRVFATALGGLEER